MQTAEIEQWAQKEFGDARIGDPRWPRRAVQMAAQAARRPAGKITETFNNDAERQGAYGLLESEAVPHEALASAMFRACARRAAEESFVFVPVDGSSLSLTDRDGSKGFGPIGSRADGARGLKVMTAMMLSSTGVPIGVSGQTWWSRPEQRRHKNRDRLRPQDKEIGRWLEVIDTTRQVMAAHAPSVRCWFQLDREGDAWPVLTQAGLGDHWFTIRATHNRRVVMDGQHHPYLFSVLAELPVASTYSLHVDGGPHRIGRQANLEIRACRLTLQLRDKRTAKRFSMDVNVVDVRERGTTPAGEKPIRWTLYTNHPIDTVEDLRQVVDGYSTRWRIEELHRTWKSGTCRVEETQLRSAEAAIKWATMLLAVGVRVERIKYLSREQPDLPATDEFTPLEIRAAALLHFGEAARTHLPPNATPTIAQVTLWIAKIGGYTGRTSSGGPPGAVTITRGLQEVRTAAKALAAAGP
jgi:hypothetical protein